MPRSFGRPARSVWRSFGGEGPALRIAGLAIVLVVAVAGLIAGLPGAPARENLFRSTASQGVGRAAHHAWQPSGQRLSSTAEPSIQQMHVYTEQELGVQPLRIPGQLQGSGEVVLLHLKIRQQTIDGSPYLTGYGFMEALSYIHVYVGGILLQPDLVIELLQQDAMRLYPAHSNDVAAVFEVFVDNEEDMDGHQWGRPFWFRAKLSEDDPQQQQPTTYDLRVLDWGRFARFTMPAALQALVGRESQSSISRPLVGWMSGLEQPAPPLDHPYESLVSVLSPPFNTKPDDVLALLLGHISWHRNAFNITGYLIYVYPEYVAPFAANPGLVQLQREGFVQFIVWDQQITEHMIDMPHTAEGQWRHRLANNVSDIPGNLPDADCVMVYNHALMITSGLGVTLMIADLDEYISTPVPKSAGQLVRECLAGGLSSVILKWRLVNCANCADVEVNDWRAALQEAGGSEMPMATHPLRRYTISSDEATYDSYGKSLLVPERTMQYRHHEGRPHREGRHESNAPCDAQILHAKRLFSLRPLEADMKNYTAWQWAFHR